MTMIAKVSDSEMLRDVQIFVEVHMYFDFRKAFICCGAKAGNWLRMNRFHVGYV